jgi:hypothetical protein
MSSILGDRADLPAKMNGKKKRSAAPRIYQWLKKEDPELAGAVHELCLEGALASGATLLYPTDAAYRNEIIDRVNSGDTNEAARLMESLIIPDAVRNGADFLSRPVGNALGVKLAVKSADGMKVQLAEGVALELARSFPNSEDVAVWRVTSGRLPLEGEPFDAYPRRAAGGGHHKRHAVKGGADNPRRCLARRVEEKFCARMLRNKCAGYDPYLAKSVSLLNYLKATHPEVLAAVLPMIDYDPLVTFYLLLEPYKAQAPFVIPEEVLFGPNGWCGASAYGDALAEYKAFFNGAAGSGSKGPYVFSAPDKVSSRVDAERQRQGGGRPNPQKVQKVYAALIAQNTIDGLQPVLPEGTLAALPGNKKLWQDEFRFVVGEAACSMRNKPVFDVHDFQTILQDLEFAYAGNKYDSEFPFFRDPQSRTDVLLLAKFINSSDFLYMPVPPDMAAVPRGSMKMDDTMVYNRNAWSLAILGRTVNMVNTSGLSPKCLAELRVYASLHGGQLPAELSSK